MMLVSLAAVVGNSQARSASIQVEIDYVSTVSNDGNGPLDLRAELNYEDTLLGAPIAVVMHPYGGVTPQLAFNAQRLPDAGFFVISPTRRGQGGSDGTLRVETALFAGRDVMEKVNGQTVETFRGARYTNPPISATAISYR